MICRPFLQMIALATRCLLIISLSLSLVQDQLTLPRVMALSAMVGAFTPRLSSLELICFHPTLGCRLGSRYVESLYA